MKQQTIKKRISALRAIMAEKCVDAVIIPQTDPHQSEYIAPHWQVREYLSGFTGSAGTLVVTATDALLWTDSRYFIQAAAQLEGTDIKLMKDMLAGTPSIETWLCQNLKEGATVGVDGMLFSVASTKTLADALAQYGIKLDTGFDVIDRVWTDRPALPQGKIFIHQEEYAGESATSKIARVLADVKQQFADSVFIAPLDEIAWTLNIRCDDVEYNPVATSYLYISADRVVLFVNENKLTPEVATYLGEHGVETYPYEKVKEFVASLPQNETLLLEPARISATLAYGTNAAIVYGNSPVAVPKAVRNQVQIKGIRKAMERDGVALVKAFKEIEEAIAAGGKITELSVADILRKHRSAQPLFFDESFGTIAGYGPHGAIVHYEADEESDVAVTEGNLLLVDSGAQYLDGTTDITRTISIGEPTAQQKHDFTLVMKGCIALDAMIYPVGTRGAQLDVEARKFLWREGLTYLHGTGHGVGHFLNVHEGPQTIRLNNTPVPLMEGMVTSDEPGLYREGRYGIRCENLVLTVKAFENENGEFLKFETLTLFPFDLKLFDKTIMSREEIEWVDNYHGEVRRRLSPYLDDAEKAWLETKTQPL